MGHLNDPWKPDPDVTYVFGGMLSLTQSINQSIFIPFAFSMITLIFAFNKSAAGWKVSIKSLFLKSQLFLLNDHLYHTAMSNTQHMTLHKWLLLLVSLLVHFIDLPQAGTAAGSASTGTAENCQRRSSESELLREHDSKLCATTTLQWGKPKH